MTLKQFLKPDWRKIVIFLIISFLEFLILIYYWSLQLHPAVFDVFEVCCRSDISEQFIEFCLEQNIPEERCMIYKQERATQGFYDLIKMIFILIFNYIFSCLIIWIYDKAKKTKKDKRRR